MSRGDTQRTRYQQHVYLWPLEEQLVSVLIFCHKKTFRLELKRFFFKFIHVFSCCFLKSLRHSDELHIFWKMFWETWSLFRPFSFRTFRSKKKIHDNHWFEPLRHFDEIHVFCKKILKYSLFQLFEALIQRKKVKKKTLI